MEPSLRQLRYFIAAADSGQFSKAAADVNVSQSAITAAIKGLEEAIGMTLFERHAGGVRLTYEGSQFLDRATQIIASLEDGRIGTVEVAEQIPTMDIGLAWPSSRSPSSACRAFVDFMQRATG